MHLQFRDSTLCPAPAPVRTLLLSVALVLGCCAPLALTAAATAAAAASAAASATAAASAPRAAAPELEVKEAWIRWMPSGLPAGGYLTLVNHTDQPLQLLGAHSDAYGTIELHRSMSSGGMTRMTKIEQITIPPHSTLDFAHAGYHLMLLQPTRALSPGERVSLALELSGGRSQSVAVELRKPTGESAHTKGMEGMPGMEH